MSTLQIQFTDHPEIQKPNQFNVPLIDERNQMAILNRLKTRFKTHGSHKEQNAFYTACTVVGLANQFQTQSIIDQIPDQKIKQANQKRFDQLIEAGQLAWFAIPNNDQLAAGVGINDDDQFVTTVEPADVCNLVDELNDQLQ